MAPGWREQAAKRRAQRRPLTDEEAEWRIERIEVERADPDPEAGNEDQTRYERWLDEIGGSRP